MTDLPPWENVYDQFRRWRDDATIECVHDALREKARALAGRGPAPSAAIVDSQSVKTCEKGGTLEGGKTVGFDGGKTVGFDGGKLVKGRKRHIAVDTRGLLLSVWVSPASVGDRDGARETLGFCHGTYPRLSLVWADGGYSGPLGQEVEKYGLALQIVDKPKGQKGFSVLPRRWVVERTFAWLGKCRRLSKDYEALPQTSEAMVRLAMVRLAMVRLAMIRLAMIRLAMVRLAMVRLMLRRLAE